MPKILYLDIETSPNLADVWGLWNQNVGLSQLKKSSRMIGFGAAWKGKKARWYGEDNHSHEDMVREAHRLLDEADIVVTYNGDRFDIKCLNAEFVTLGLTPPSPSKSIDLFKVVKKNFKFPSNKLQYVCTRLLKEGKISNGGHILWNECLDPDIPDTVRAKAWKLMAKYCKQDVNLLEPLHTILIPWLPESVNIRLYAGPGLGCQKCGSDNLKPRGTRYTATRAYPQYRCDDCGGWTRDHKASWSLSSGS